MFMSSEHEVDRQIVISEPPISLLSLIKWRDSNGKRQNFLVPTRWNLKGLTFDLLLGRMAIVQSASIRGEREDQCWWLYVGPDT